MIRSMGGEIVQNLTKTIESTMMHIGQNTENSDIIVAGARKGQIFVTEDGGRNWLQMKLPDEVEGVYAVACL